MKIGRGFPRPSLIFDNHACKIVDGYAVALLVDGFRSVCAARC